MSNSELTISSLATSSRDMEGALLGMLLNKQDLVYQVASRVKPEFFDDPYHKAVVKAMLDLVKESKAVHSITVMQRIIENEKGTSLDTARNIVLGLTDKWGGRDSFILNDVVAGVVEAWQRRELLVTAQRVMVAASDPTSHITKSLSLNRELTDDIINGGNTELSTKEHVDNFLATAKTLSEQDNPMLGPGIFGLEKLNRALDGAAPGGVVLFAGWTGSGKTVCFNNILVEATKQGIPVCSWSGEQSEGKQIGGVIGGLIRVNKRAVEKGAFHKEQKLIDEGVQAKVDFVSDKIVDAGHVFLSGEMDEHRIMSTMSFQFYVNGITTFLFDRKELFSVDGMKDDDKAIGLLISKIRTHAVNLGVWVGIASQLTKGHLNKGGCVAGIGDVLGSIAATSAATAVVIIHRYAAYEIYSDNKGRSLRDEVLLRVVKNSYGVTVEVLACFKGAFGLFVEPDDIDSTLAPANNGLPKKKKEEEVDPNPTEITKDDDVPF